MITFLNSKGDIMNISKIRDEFLKGKPVIITDRNRESEGDMVFPSEIADEKIINMFITHGRGLLCTCTDENILTENGFFKLPVNGYDKHYTNFFIPVDYKKSDTGISAYERAQTVKKLSEKPKISEFIYPGHVSLLGGKGLENRRGHTEASVELCELCGFSRFSVIVEILDEKGNSHNFDYIRELSEKFKILTVSVEEIFEEMISKKNIVKKVSEAFLPTEYGNFKIVGFEGLYDGKEDFLIYKGNTDGEVYVRVHSECVTGDVLSSLKCDCGNQLKNSMKYINEKNNGIIIYLRQEGRNIGITDKIRTYELQDRGYDTYEANEKIGRYPDERDYDIAAQMLKAMAAENIILLTNNPEKKKSLEKYGINVLRTERIYGEENDFNRFYLKTKKERFNHIL